MCYVKGDYKHTHQHQLSLLALCSFNLTFFVFGHTFTALEGLAAKAPDISFKSYGEIKAL